jgi:hypothetical protein
MISSETGSESIKAAACASGISGVTRAAAGWARPTAMLRLPPASTLSRSSGPNTVVASRSSMMAGPAIVLPGASA